MPVLDLGPALRAAGHRLVRTVDGLPDADWAAPSLLPGWTRAHVVAHLVLHAEALAGCIDGALAGEDVPMYASPEARDGDITALAGASADVLRERLLGATTEITDSLGQLAQASLERPDLLSSRADRYPGSGSTFLLGDAAAMRLREVEVHHVDLDAGYRTDQWHPAVSELVIEAMAARPVAAADAVLAPTDHGRRWVLGSGGPVVSGPLHALAWWVSGRPAGPELTSDNGAMPRTEHW